MKPEKQIHIEQKPLDTYRGFNKEQEIELEKLRTQPDPYINWEIIGNFSAIESDVQAHLGKVYLTLTFLVAIAALGSYIQILTQFEAAPLFMIVGFVILLYLYLFSSYDETKSQKWRLAGLYLFAFLEGMSIGPLINLVLEIDPKIVTVAFLGTVIVFGSFTGTALYSRRRKYVYLGGILLTALNVLVFLSIFSVLYNTTFFTMMNLYGGLILFCFYVIYDTQMIIEKRHAGNKDYILHAMELFIDFMAIFIRILIIIAKKQRENRDR